MQFVSGAQPAAVEIGLLEAGDVDREKRRDLVAAHDLHPAPGRVRGRLGVRQGWAPRASSFGPGVRSIYRVGPFSSRVEALSSRVPAPYTMSYRRAMPPASQQPSLPSNITREYPPSHLT